MTVKMKSFLSFVVLLTGVIAAQDESVEYGADLSFPMHYNKASSNFAWLPHNIDPENNPTPPELEGQPIQYLGDKQSWYTDLIDSCVEHYGRDEQGERCLDNEKDRVEMNLRQPQSVVNYTKYGFTKIRAPEHVFKLIQEFWELNKDKAKPEQWPAGNTYTNHWLAPSTIVSVEDKSYKGGGLVLKQNIWNAARDTISEWTGQQLAECSLYGIRVYPEGAMLATHVDRLPLVASAIINVDQDVDEPWPLEVIGHDGKAHNVTMVPGDLVLYESHSILHGRPFPLKGRFMANVFIHFEPIGPVGGEIVYGTTDLPPYLISGSPEEENWRIRNPNGHEIMKTEKFTSGTTDAHKAASRTDIVELEEYVNLHEEVVNTRDVNGWIPLHEAVRRNSVEIVRFLLERGSEVNLRTGNDKMGGTPLFLAQDVFGEVHPIVDLLKEYNAIRIEPGENIQTHDGDEL